MHLTRVLEETGCSSGSCKIAGSDMLVSNTDGDEIGLVVLVSRSGAGDRGDGDRGLVDVLYIGDSGKAGGACCLLACALKAKMVMMMITRTAMMVPIIEAV